MSCNGCRILRKGCSEDCVLRQCIEWINSPQAQANATVFVAKFFGRAGLMSFISSVPKSQGPSLFRSLLFEAVGRTVNPVSGAVGLLWTGNWHVCQKAVRTVLRRGTVEPQPELEGGVFGPEFDNVSECDSVRPPADHVSSGSKTLKRKRDVDAAKRGPMRTDLDLCLMYQRVDTPPEESETTTLESGSGNNCRFHDGGEPKLLRLFV